MLRLPRPASLILGIGVAIVVIAVPAGAGFAAYQHDVSNRGKLPRHTVVGGVDVGGLSRAQALALVTAAADRRLDRVTTIRVSDHVYRTSLRSLGVRDDVTLAVDAAFATTGHGSWMSRVWHSVVGGGDHPTVAVRFTQPRPALVRSLVRHIVRTSRMVPVDASAQIAGTGLRFTNAKTGLGVTRHQTKVALLAALRAGGSRTLIRHVLQPKVPDSTFSTVILVHVNENMLYLYKHHHIVASYPVATGQSIYPTPLGQFKVVLKRFMPTWYNPHDIWSVNEPETIPPGPSNPLGLRALNLSAAGIRIHGTPSDYSIGYNASHGCIRMHNSDVLKLYPRVPTGTPVFIAQVGPYRPLGSSLPPTKTVGGEGELTATDEAENWSGPAPQLLTLWRAEAAIAIGLPVACLAIGLGVGVAPIGAVITLVVGAVAYAAVWRSLGRRFRSWGYSERGDDLLVRRGVLVHRLSVVPYGRMQFVDVLAGPFERRMGLAGVHLHTAAAATDAHIPGLPAAEAARLRDRLAALGEARAAGL